MPMLSRLRPVRASLPDSCCLASLGASTALAQQWLNAGPNPKTNQSNFRAIEEWPDPNDVRTASGSPGPKYWQQRVDYVIRAIAGYRGAHGSPAPSASPITTTRRMCCRTSGSSWTRTSTIPKVSRTIASESALPAKISPQARKFLLPEPFDGGYRLGRVQVQVPASAKGKAQLVDVPYVINGTRVKIPLPTPLASGASAVLEIDWSYAVPENSRNGRGVRELVKDGWLYEMAQWYPRVVGVR